MLTTEIVYGETTLNDEDTEKLMKFISSPGKLKQNAVNDWYNVGDGLLGKILLFR